MVQRAGGRGGRDDMSEESELTELRFHEPLIYIIIFVWWRVWLQVSKCQVWIQRSVTFNGETLAELRVIRGSRWECCHVSNYICQHLSGFHGKELRGSERQTEGDNAQKWMRECNGVVKVWIACVVEFMRVWLWPNSHTFRVDTEFDGELDSWQSHTVLHTASAMLLLFFDPAEKAGLLVLDGLPACISLGGQLVLTSWKVPQMLIKSDCKTS